MLVKWTFSLPGGDVTGSRISQAEGILSGGAATKISTTPIREPILLLLFGMPSLEVRAPELRDWQGYPFPGCLLLEKRMPKLG